MTKQNERGSVTLETCIVLPIFLFLFLFVFGLFGVVSAHNQMTHALIQSAKSMSLDSYLLENVDSAGEAGTKFWGGLSDMVLDLVRLDNDPYFTSDTDWYKTDNGSEIAKKRFIGYFAGGDASEADKKLKALKITNGLDGVSFTVDVQEEIFTVTMKYNIQYWFDFLDSGKIPMEQTIKGRLWK